MGKKRSLKWVKKLRNFAPVFIITLIGMPSAGKTKAGKWLATSLGWDFVDIDDEIVTYKRVKTLQELVDNLSAEEFAGLENYVAIRTVMRLTKPTIIATGGSVIYLEQAMSVLRERTLVVYLYATRDWIVRRLKRDGNGERRGIVRKKGQTYGHLYDERTPLLKKAADLVIPTGGDRERVAASIAKKIMRALAA